MYVLYIWFSGETLTSNLLCLNIHKYMYVLYLYIYRIWGEREKAPTLYISLSSYQALVLLCIYACIRDEINRSIMNQIYVRNDKVGWQIVPNSSPLLYSISRLNKKKEKEKKKNPAPPSSPLHQPDS